MEPNLVTIEAAASEYMAFDPKDPVVVARVTKIVQQFMDDPVLLLMFQRAKNSLMVIPTEEKLLNALFSFMAMSIMVGWNAGVGATEGMKLEEMIK